MYATDRKRECANVILEKERENGQKRKGREKKREIKWNEWKEENDSAGSEEPTLVLRKALLISWNTIQVGG